MSAGQSSTQSTQTPTTISTGSKTPFSAVSHSSTNTPPLSSTDRTSFVTSPALPTTLSVTTSSSSSSTSSTTTDTTSASSSSSAVLSSTSTLSSSIPASVSITSSTFNSSTSTYETTSVGTTNGAVFTTVLSQTTIFAPGSTATSRPNHSTTNIGAIVGGVVGGVGGLAVLLLVVFLLLRWRKKKSLDDEFDGNFDPGRLAAGQKGSATMGGTLPNISLNEIEDDGMGGRLAASDLGIRGTVTPFVYGSQQGQGSQSEMSEKARMMAAHNGSHGHSQSSHGASQAQGSSLSSPYPPPQSPPFPVPNTIAGSTSSEGGYAPTGSSVYGYYSQGPVQPHQQHHYPQPFRSGQSSSPGPSFGSGSVHGQGYPNEGPSISGAGAASMTPFDSTAKEREAAVERRAHVANPGSENMNRPAGSSDVVVHQDGGRLDLGRGHELPDDGEAQQEIPPTYDSLPPEARRP
ncbi:hypothetical protein AX17_004155 [Amanita inopinata Kibby_2008]|nr:hypothetical protein AX17_004155 [Amanita inopinata Kibby_2008]